MENDENLIEVEKLEYRPFTKFCMSIGAVPSSYIAGMTIPEQILWLSSYLEKEVVPAVNNNGEAVEELQNLFVELKTYVDNYFEDLDVQEEINNKLDELVENGTLTNLIGAYIQPRIDEQNAHINETITAQNTHINEAITAQNTLISETTTEQNEQINRINTKVNAATSGSPLIATSTSGMTNQDRIYVNTTDGYWYYYDGSNWTRGGLYQSVNLSDKSVHYPMLDDELQASATPFDEPTDIITTYGGVTNVEGTIESPTAGSLQYYEFSANAFDTYKVHIRYDSSIFSNDKPFAQFLNNTTVISNILKTDVTITDNIVDTVFTVPYGANKVRINTRKFTGKPYLQNYINKVNLYEVNNIEKRQLDSKLQSFFENQYEEVTPTLFCPHAYMNSGDTYNYTSSDIWSLEVKPHDVYRVTMTQVESNPIILFLTNNAVSTKTLNGNDYQLNNFVEYIQDVSSRHEFEDYVFEIPSYCEKIYINKWNNIYGDVFKIEKCTSYKVNESDIVSNTNKVGFEKLIAIGDSLTEVNFRCLHNYLHWIKQDIPTLTIQNLGAGGTGYYNGGTLNNPYVNRIDSISSYNLDTDVILVFGSVNDVQYVGSNLGELGDTTTSTNYGAMYNFFSTLFTEFNGVRIGCVSPLNWKYGTASEANLNLYIQALKDTCELFKVPFLDIHEITNLRPENDAFLNEYYTADGTRNDSELDTSGIHPNSKGHHLFYSRIKEFINTL